MTDPLVGTDLDLAADVCCNLTAQVTLNLEVDFDVVAQRNELLVRQILYTDFSADPGVGEGFEGPRTANTVDVSQCDLYALVAGCRRRLDVPWWLLL